MGMRIGGAFPFNASGAFPVQLTGGEFFYPPAGNYLMTLGAQTCLQWWDPIQYSWRNLAQPNAETFQISTDGYNWRLANLSGIVIGASITNAGSGGTNGIGPTQTGSTVSFAAGSSSPGGTAQGYVIVGGSVAAPTITQAGSGFKVPPLVLIDPPPVGGIQATATCALTSGGGITSVTMGNVGAGYTVTPNFYLVPQFQNQPGSIYNDPYGVAPVAGAQNVPPGIIGGTALPPQTFMQGLSLTSGTGGALLTPVALTGTGTLTGVVVTHYGYGYTSVPAMTFANTTGALAGGVAATSLMSWGVTALTGGSGVAYTVGNKWESSMGYLTAGTTNFYNNNLLQPRIAQGVLTSTVGALTIEDGGFGMQKVLVAGNFGVAQGGTIATTSIVFSGIAMGGITDTSIIQMMVD